MFHVLKRTRLVNLFLAALALAGLVAWTPSPAVGAMTLKVGCLESPDGPNTLGWKTFEQYVESASGGSIQVDIYPSSQLGDSEKLLEGLKLGIHQIAQGDESITGAYAPMLIWFTPYLFPDEQVMKKFFESPVFEEINDRMAKELGVRVLGAAPYGFYNFINKTRPIKTLADMKGLKLRTLPNSQLTIKTWGALGASATPVPWAEIYTSMKTGVIDGLGHTLTIMVDQKYYEVAKSVTLDMSMGCANLYLVNEKWYQSLSEADKAIIKRGAEMGSAAEFGIATYRNRAIAVETLKKNGVEVSALSPEEKAKFRKTAHQAVIPWVKEKAGAELVDKVLKTVEALAQGRSGK
ncbi:MAG: TRAP transporter substrate-binding protein [Thermodesulfobacteriota bacterium]